VRASARPEHHSPGSAAGKEFVAPGFIGQLAEPVEIPLRRFLTRPTATKLDERDKGMLKAPCYEATGRGTDAQLPPNDLRAGCEDLKVAPDLSTESVECADLRSRSAPSIGSKGRARFRAVRWMIGWMIEAPTGDLVARPAVRVPSGGARIGTLSASSPRGSTSHLAAHRIDLSVISDGDVVRVRALLEECAVVFAASRTAHTRQLRHTLDFGTRGLGSDEGRAFLRALDSGLVRVFPDGEFTLPGAAHNLNRPHLVGEDGKGGVTLHTEYLIHIGAYAELVLDHDWPRERLAFDMGAWDLHGLRRDGSISLLMEAKARFDGREGLARLRDDLHGLVRDPSRAVNSTTRRKYEALVEVCRASPVYVWLVADGCRMLYRARSAGRSVEVTVTQGMPSGGESHAV
jgi:hypothetical protein